LLFDLDVGIESTLVADLVKEIAFGSAHFKGGFTGQGRVVVANNGFYNYARRRQGCTSGTASSAWRSRQSQPHMECAGGPTWAMSFSAPAG